MDPGQPSTDYSKPGRPHMDAEAVGPQTLAPYYRTQQDSMKDIAKKAVGKSPSAGDSRRHREEARFSPRRQNALSNLQ